MQVAEIFYSIQGEGPAMGRPATFVRFAGCNLGCEGCDTDHRAWKELSPQAVLMQIKGERVVITGGEPTLQMEALSELVHLLFRDGKEVHLETNGTAVPDDKCMRQLHLVVVSPKRGSWVDFALWSSFTNVHFKFVLGPQGWCWNEKGLEDLMPRLPAERAWIMPFGADQGLALARDAWDLALRLGVNYSDRLHIRLCRR